MFPSESRSKAVSPLLFQIADCQLHQDRSTAPGLAKSAPDEYPRARFEDEVIGEPKSVRCGLILQGCC